MFNAVSKNIERRNKAGINPPWTPAENSGTRLRRAKQRIAERKGVKPAQAGPASAAQLKRASLRAERLSGRAQKTGQAIYAATGGLISANSQYDAAKKAGKNMGKRDLGATTKQMKTYQKAMKSQQVAKRALSLYAAAKPRRRKPR
jgi:two-component SAPR family response regulator